MKHLKNKIKLSFLLHPIKFMHDIEMRNTKIAAKNINNLNYITRTGKVNYNKINKIPV